MKYIMVPLDSDVSTSESKHEWGIYYRNFMTFDVTFFVLCIILYQNTIKFQQITQQFVKKKKQSDTVDDW